MNTYLISKLIHRWLVGLLTILGIIVAVTGLILEEKDSSTWLGIDMTLIRQLHAELAQYLAYLLFAMILTGLVLYFFPYYQKSKIAKNTNRHLSEDSKQ